MSKWYRRVTSKPDDYGNDLIDALDYFEREHEAAQKELHTDGKRIETVAKNIPGIIEHRFSQLQEIEAILSYFELLADRKHSEVKKNFLEHYNTAMTDRRASQYADANDEVFQLRQVVIEIARVRNLFLSITKGLETLHYQLGNIVKLRVAGIEDASF